MPELLSQLRSIEALSAKHGASGLDYAERLEAVRLAQSIVINLEDPGDMVDRFIFQPAENALIRIAIDMGLFQVLHRSKAPLNAQSLAEATDAEVTLLERILRGLVAMHAIEEVGAEDYRPTKISEAFAMAKGASGMRVFFDEIHPTWLKLPEILRSTNHRNPTDPNHTGMQLAYNTTDNFFAHLTKNPDALRHFGVFMAEQAVGRPNFLDYYPATEQLIHGFRTGENQVMLVDVGGATGEEALEFRRRYPSAPGRLLVQDRPSVIEQLPDTLGLEKMAHDFFTPQPIRGARAYYFRRILHDWPDAQAKEILLHTARAMAVGYSKVLINELVVPRRRASPFATNSDINMMALLSAVERTENHWRELLQGAGLKVVKIWTPRGGEESIIQAMLE